jgi:hypothetical protein
MVGYRPGYAGPFFRGTLDKDAVLGTLASLRGLTRGGAEASLG